MVPVEHWHGLAMHRAMIYNFIPFVSQDGCEAKYDMKRKKTDWDIGEHDESTID